MKSVLREAAWLLGWYALAVLLLGSLVGFRSLLHGGTLDIQMHNTYFVVAWRHLALLLFWLLATLGTVVRAALARFRQRQTNAVLAGLLGLSLLPLALLGCGLWQGLHRGRAGFLLPDDTSTQHLTVHPGVTQPQPADRRLATVRGVSLRPYSFFCWYEQLQSQQRLD